MNNIDKRPIGIFDSGLGGLTVVKSFQKLLPNESIVYFGDTARVPYGIKSKNLVLQYSIKITKFLIKQNAKLIIVACNTATAMALNELREKFIDVPIIGVIDPGVKKAVSITKTNNIGVIGTIATINSKAYYQSIKTLNSNIKIYSKACPLFVPFVEEGLLKGKAISEVVKYYLNDFEHKVDTLILGCTHYPLLKEAISNVTKDIVLIDSAYVVANSAKDILSKHKLLNEKNNQGLLLCYVTDLPMKFDELGNIFLGSKINSVTLVDDF